MTTAQGAGCCCTTFTATLLVLRQQRERDLSDFGYQINYQTGMIISHADYSISHYILDSNYKFTEKTRYCPLRSQNMGLFE